MRGMAKTDTRQRVRELAQKISEQGRAPTPTVVRRLLGGGSPNLIVDELRAWRKDQAGLAKSPTQAAGGPPAYSTADLGQIKEDLAEVRQVLAALREDVRHATASRRTLTPERQCEEALSATGGADELGAQIHARLCELLAGCRAQAEATENVAQRFDAVQRMTLMSVEEARAETRSWKERYHALQDEMRTWRTSLSAQNSALGLECAQLKGQLEELRRSAVRPLA
jgi:hypothetical protein